MNVKTRTFSGTTSNEVTDREIRNKNISRKAATEGVVLLKNNGLLPLSTSSKIAIFGNGIARIIKGGTGSGDVNERAVASMLEGLESAGYEVINKKSAEKFMADHIESRMVWRDNVLSQLKSLEGSSDMAFFGIIANAKGKEVDEMSIEEAEIKSADAVLYIVSRVAGEGTDRQAKAGDYYLTDIEKNQIEELSKYSTNIVLLVNTGAQIDIADLQSNEAIKSIVYISQPGMEAGHVIADIVSGKVNPSGKLTTTWSKKYEDFPNAATFSHCNGDTKNEKYEEGIFVGYRYFDSFGVETLYPFGYGLSYTSFSTTDVKLAAENNTIRITAKVTNTGDKYAGKQVVQIYASCPFEARNRELKKLIGYKKTSLLAPGECENVEIVADAKDIAAYDYEKAAWVVDAGEYAIFVSENVDENILAGVLNVEEECVLEKVSHISSLQTTLEELEAPQEIAIAFKEKWKKESVSVDSVSFCPKGVINEKMPDGELAKKAMEIASQMSDDELVAMLVGEITKGQDNIKENELVKTGIFVPGAAGETSCRFEEKYNIPAISMADGPAGLRLMRSYDVDNDTNLIYGHGVLSALEGGILATEYHRENVTTYHLYATAIPIGTLLAQTWDTDLIEEVGQMIGQEMEYFGIAWWLAPGMCIHRNPLCGRNFEYYSEDPIISGTMAAAMTRGVQSVPGVGTTIKHFACNNQEDNRLFSNSIVSERALREIYIRGFELAVKSSQPMCLMTSYNLINGVPAANNYDLITTVLRGEWDFKGIVMSDWTTTTAGSASPYKCAEAGNDLIMPGNQIDVDDITKALADGTLDRQKAIECAARMINLLWNTLGMENPKPYNEIYK